MLHPIFATVLGRPELIVNHLAGYAELVREEAAAAGRSFMTRLVGGVLFVVSALLALIMAGVAVMLGVLHGSFNWVLVIVPGIAVLVAAVCAVIASRPAKLNAFGDLCEQFQSDLKAFNSLKESRHEE